MDEPTTPSPSRRIPGTLWIGVGLTVLLAAATLLLMNWQRRSRAAAKPLLVLGQVNAFTLTNQLGQPVTLTNLLGRVWVADVIFTRCQSSCLNLTRRMAALQARLPSGEPVQLVSLTADPENDSPSVLQQYAETHGADAARWQFLTGPKKELYRLAIDDLKFVVVDRTQASCQPLEEMFLHSTLFAVVDRRGRVRGYFEGTEPAAQEQVLAAVGRLLKEK